MQLTHVGNPEPSPVAGEGVETLWEALMPHMSEEKVQTTNAKAAAKAEVGDRKSTLRSPDGASANLEMEEVVGLYQSGLSAPKIAARLGCGSTTVYRCLKKAGVCPKDVFKERGRKGFLFTPEQESEIAEKYEKQKLSLSQLGELYDCSYVTIRNILRRLGVTLAPKGNRYRDFSNAEIAKMKRLYANGMAQTAIADEFKTHQTVIGRALRANGVEPRTRAATGERHGNWKGGSLVVAGYRYVRAPRDSLIADMVGRNGYVAEHRLVMARQLGRSLSKNETVHHKDGDRLNNDPDNLELRSGRHGRGVVCHCADCGSRNIVFDNLEANAD